MFCSQCGEANHDTVRQCVKCGSPLAPSAMPAAKKSSATTIYVVIGIGLAIFLTIIAILAAIAISGFLEFQTRAKVSRTLSDLRSMATAIEAYYVDNATYPAWSVGADSLNGNQYPSFTLRSFNNQLGTLTTPIAYITGYFPDPFAPTPNLSFNYYRIKSPPDDYRHASTWILWSAGPDEVYDIDLNVLEEMTVDSFAILNMHRWPLELLPYTFDPTNGTISSGDIFRVKN